MTAMIALLGGTRATIWFVGMLLFASLFGLKTCEHDRYVTKIEKEKAVEVKRVQAALNSYHKSVADWSGKFYELEKTRTKKAADLQRDVATGKRVLKPRFSCPTAPAPRGDGGEERGLRREDAGFLIGEAERADTIVGQLQFCQFTLREHERLNK